MPSRIRIKSIFLMLLAAGIALYCGGCMFADPTPNLTLQGKYITFSRFEMGARYDFAVADEQHFYYADSCNLLPTLIKARLADGKRVGSVPLKFIHSIACQGDYLVIYGRLKGGQVNRVTWLGEKPTGRERGEDVCLFLPKTMKLGKNAYAFSMAEETREAQLADTYPQADCLCLALGEWASPPEAWQKIDALLSTGAPLEPRNTRLKLVEAEGEYSVLLPDGAAIRLIQAPGSELTKAFEQWGQPIRLIAVGAEHLVLIFTDRDLCNLMGNEVDWGQYETMYTKKTIVLLIRATDCAVENALVIDTPKEQPLYADERGLLSLNSKDCRLWATGWDGARRPVSKLMRFPTTSSYFFNYFQGEVHYEVDGDRLFLYAYHSRLSDFMSWFSDRGNHGYLLHTVVDLTQALGK